MKTLKTLYIGIAAALLSSCIQEVQPEGQHVSGMWAIVNEQSQTTSYLKFEDGYMTTCTTVIPSDYKTVADGRMWHASENDFKPISTQRYSLSAENQLFLDGKHSGEMTIDGDSMTYGKQKAVAVTGFTSDYYSTVTTSVADDQIKANFLSQEMEFDYAVTNPVPNSRVQVIVSPGDMATVRLSDEGKMTIALPEVNASSVSSIILRYPGAKDLVFSLVREASTAIDVEKTVWEYNYPACEVSIPFTLVNPAEGGSVAAELVSTSPWVKNVSVSSSMLTLSLDENNDSSNSYRGASIKLSAKGALDVYVGIRQFYTAPIVYYTPSGLSTDYKSKTGQSFSYVVNNTRSGGNVTVSCSSAWITNLEDNTGTVNFDVSENNSGATRYASIVTRYSFGNTYVSYYFSVSQSYSSTGITLTPTSQSTDYTAKSLSFTYAISNPRDGATASATTTDAWITDVKLSGNTVSYKVAENNSGSQRTGKIRLTYGTTYKDFSVTQSYAASTITCSPESQSTDYTAKSLSFTAAVANLREGCTLAASTSDDWITDVKLSGTTVSYKVAENNSGASRTGKIKLTYGSVSKEFSVTQTYTASVITCDPSSQSTDYTAKSLSFTATVSNLREGCTLAASTTDTWIANVQLSGNTVSYKVAENNSGAQRTGKIRLSYGSIYKDFSVTQECKPAVPDLIDLGLSVKWASFNVGASKPEDYGAYYQWAGTEDVTSIRINLDWSNCPYHTGSDQYTGWTKYVPSAKSSYWSGTGNPDNKTVLDPSDDVAHVMWGGSWRMPTDAEWTELSNTDNCSWTWTTINGINGYKVQSKKSGYTDNWIFLPAAGLRSIGYLFNVGSDGYYWSSSCRMVNPGGARGVYFYSGYVNKSINDRYYGQSVRPVSE